ncbi:MAG: dual specificity protein phosphatase family protein [Candidatus Xenobia bacterium]
MEVSKITDQLYHGTHPFAADYRVLKDLGIELIINMQARAGPHAEPAEPITNLWLRTHDNPITRIPIYVLAQGALVARTVMDRGGKVFVHCRQGRHRSSAMVGAILVSLGYTPEDAVKTIKAGRPRANPGQWYIRERIDRFGRVWVHPRAERSRALVQMALEYQKQKNLEAAARCLRLAIGNDPHNLEAWQLQVKVLEDWGKPESATTYRTGLEWLQREATRVQ